MSSEIPVTLIVTVKDMQVRVGIFALGGGGFCLLSQNWGVEPDSVIHLQWKVVHSPEASHSHYTCH